MHIEDDRLQDYIDGRLGAAERAEVDRHLAVCVECFGSARALRGLLGELAALPHGIAPARDLRPAINAAIDAAGRRMGGGFLGRSVRSARYALAAAAILLIALSSVVTAFLMSRGDSGGGAIAASTPAFAAAEFRITEANYITATDELERALRELRTLLAPETVRILEENLSIIDEALAETRAALAADPHNQALSELIVAAYQKKLDLLRRAVEVPVSRGVL